MKSVLGMLFVSVLVFGFSGAAQATPTSDQACVSPGDVSPTVALAMERLLGDPAGFVEKRVRSRCQFRCRCTYMAKRKLPCKRVFVLTCQGRLCSRCLGRAKLKARNKCRARGAVRRCTCTFKRLRVLP